MERKERVKTRGKTERKEKNQTIKTLKRKRREMIAVITGTHPWSECSLNPRSKNFHLNPSSPFYRGGGSGGPSGRNGGRGNSGRFQGRGGRGHYDHGRGRGGSAGSNRYNNSDYNNRPNDQYYGGDRSVDRGREPSAQDQQGQYNGPTPGQDRVADQYQQQQQYHNHRPGGWWHEGESNHEMHEDSDGLHLDKYIDTYFYGGVNHRNDSHFMTELDAHLTTTNDKYEPVTTPVPKSFLIARTINATTSARILTVLFDSGGSGCWISERALPRGCPKTQLNQPITSLTLAGTLSSSYVVHLQQIILPEFDRNKTIEKQGAYVFPGPCNYDIILGRDFLDNVGIILDFATGTMQWMDKSVSMAGTTQQQQQQTEN
jgi:hypothetical protein